jgi:hypothetical protein
MAISRLLCNCFPIAPPSLRLSLFKISNLLTLHSTPLHSTHQKIEPQQDDGYELDDLESFMDEGDKYVAAESFSNNNNRERSGDRNTYPPSYGASTGSGSSSLRGDGGGGAPGKNADGKNLPDSMVEYCKPEDCVEIQELINQRQEYR